MSETIDFRAIEKKWQERWAREKIFEADPKPGKPKFFMTSPYPYTTGPYHIGHGRSYSTGDVYARFWRTQGYHVLYPMAFHITGTPVLAISRGIEQGDPEIVNLYREYVSLVEKDPEKVEEIVQSFRDPWNVVRFFSQMMKRDFSSLGMSIDWRREFTTGDPEYNRFIEWQFYKLKEGGYLTTGKYPVYYCLNDENAVGEDDIKKGDEIDLTVHEFVIIKFRYRDGFLVPATLRPETIYGVTNLWVKPSGKYVKARVDGEVWYLSREGAEKLGYQDHQVEILEEMEGRELVGDHGVSPITGRSVPVLPGEFVDTDTATGVVYSVPGHSVADLVALWDLKREAREGRDTGVDPSIVEGIEPIKIIESEKYKGVPAEEVARKHGIETQHETDKIKKATEELYKNEHYSGRMSEECTEIAGLPVEEAKKKIVEVLKRENASSVILHPATWPIKCRCGGRVVIRVIEGQWFIDYNAPGWKEKARRALDRMVVFPEKYRRAFEAYFEWLDKRPCARKRGLGTRLPFDRDWIIESLSDSTIYMAFYTIIHHIRKNKIKPEQLEPEFFDYVYLGKGDPESVAQKTGIDRELLEEMRREFEYWYPVDQRNTAIMHMSNHLSFFIFHHVAIFPEDKWPRAVTMFEPVLREGEKMGKSKGNVIPLCRVGEEYGADLFRLYTVTSATFDSYLDWREEDVARLKKQMERVYRFISNSGKLEGEWEETLLARAYRSRFYSLLEEARSHARNYDLFNYSRTIFYRVYNLLAEYEKHAGEKEKPLLRDLTRDWIIALSPVTPHMCEELWEERGGEGFVSLQEWREPGEGVIDKRAEDALELANRIIEDVKHIQKLVGRTGERVVIVPAREWKYELYEHLKRHASELNPKNAAKIAMELESARAHGKEAVRIAQRVAKAKDVLERAPSREEELEAIQGFREMISRSVGAEVVVASEAGSTEKEEKAEPGKPAIILE